MKTLIPSTIAICLTFSSLAHAQEDTAAAPPEDPVVSSEVARLQELDLILRQSKLGEDILILDREVARAAALKALIAEIGPDGFRAAYPELAAALENSPMMLRAEKEVAELSAELAAVTAPPASTVPAANAPALRNDGSDLLRGASAEPKQAVIPDVPEAPEATAPDNDTDEDFAAPLMPEDPPSLREIHGLSGSYQAVVALGSERTLVIKGDTLPGGYTVEEIGESWIDLRKDEETVRLNIRG